MKLAKQSSKAFGKATPGRGETSPLKIIDTDLNNLFLFASGRVRFGTGVDNARGENISGQFQVFTSDGVADTEFTVTHNTGAIPIGYIVIKQNKAGKLYRGGTTWNETTAYFKCNVASVTFTIFLLK